MNKMIFALTLLLSVSIFNCATKEAPQEETKIETIVETQDEKLIKEKIHMYFDGWMTGDTLKLGRAMQMTCQLKNVIDDKVKVFDRATYLGFFKPRPRKQNTEGRILKIDVTGNIGSAKCEIETPEMLFTDYFNLMRLGEEWFIVDKIATSKKK